MERKIEVPPHWTLQDTVTEAHQVWTFVIHTLTHLVKVPYIGHFGTLEGCAYADLLVILSMEHDNFQLTSRQGMLYTPYPTYLLSRLPATNRLTLLHPHCVRVWRLCRGMGGGATPPLFPDCGKLCLGGEAEKLHPCPHPLHRSRWD